MSTGSHGSCVARKPGPSRTRGRCQRLKGSVQSSAGSFERPSLSTRAHGPSWTSGHVISADTCGQRPGTRVCLRGTLQEETERNEGAPAQASPEEPAQKPRHKVRGGGRGSRAPRIPTMRLLPGVGSALQAAAPEWGGGAQAGLRAPPERLWSSSPRQRQFGIYPGPSRHYPPLTAFQGLNADHMQSCPPAQPAARGPPIGSVQDGK